MKFASKFSFSNWQYSYIISWFQTIALQVQFKYCITDLEVSKYKWECLNWKWYKQLKYWKSIFEIILELSQTDYISLLMPKLTELVRSYFAMKIVIIVIHSSFKIWKFEQNTQHVRFLWVEAGTLSSCANHVNWTSWRSKRRIYHDRWQHRRIRYYLYL